MLTNMVYSYNFNRSKSKFLQFFLKTESCADSVKFQCCTRIFLAGLKVSNLLLMAFRTTLIADRTIGTTVICSISHWCLILKIILCLFDIGL